MSKHAVVTGASRGLGHALALRLAAEGWGVSVGARSGPALVELVEEIRVSGGDAWGTSCDVANPDDVDSLFSGATAELGPVNEVVHCAARYGPFGSIERVDAKDWEAAIDTNLKGTFHVLRACASHVERTPVGRIVVLSGGGATSPMPSVSAYASSKAAIVRLVETFAHEFMGRGLVANALAPGLMATAMLDEVLAVDPQLIDAELRVRMLRAKDRNENSMPEALDAAVFLVAKAHESITGRLISALWDPWIQWAERPEFVNGQDAYTLRRLTPENLPAPALPRSVQP